MYLKRTSVALGSLVAAAGLGIGTVSLAPVRASDPDWLLETKLVAKGWVLSGMYAGIAIVDPLDEGRFGPSTPLEGDEFFYEDLDHPYLARVRNDPRVAELLARRPDVAEASAMADFLRSSFPRQRNSTPVERVNVLELLDRAEAGEGFLCGTISKMLVQLFQAAGGNGRLVRLGGHVVAEIWSPTQQKWVLIDADTNVRFENRAGVSLSVLDMHELVLRGERDAVVTIEGATPTPYLYDDDYLKPGQDLDYTEYQLQKYYRNGFAVDYYAEWLTLDLPTWDPRTHPFFTSVFTSRAGASRPGELRQIRRDASDPAVLYAPPAVPAQR
jgi:hypothetical protein